MSRRQKRRGISLGTIVMLVITICVSTSLGYVLPRLQGNYSFSADPAKVLEAFSLSWLPELSMNEIPIQFTVHETDNAMHTEQPGAQLPAVTDNDQMQTAASTATAAVTATPQPAATPTIVPAQNRSFTITFTGSIMLEDSIRKGAWIDEADKYDFSEMLGYIAPELKSGDLCVVTVENIIDDEAEFSDLITTSAMVPMLAEAGIDAVGLAHPKAANEGVEGIRSTISALRANGISVLGVHGDEQNAGQTAVMTLGGVKVAVLQYTDSLTAGGQKKLNNAAAEYAVDVASADRISADIAMARLIGAEVVIVCVNWGADDSTTPNKAQKTMAQAIADAGADVIIGTGTKAVQPAVWLQGNGQNHKTLCAYSLGALLNEGRSDKNVASYILQLGFTVDSAGLAEIENMTCIPTYTWRYKADGKYRYFVVPSAEIAPDDMSESQVESKERALKNVRKTLSDAPFAVPEMNE